MGRPYCKSGHLFFSAWNQELIQLDSNCHHHNHSIHWNSNRYNTISTEKQTIYQPTKEKLSSSSKYWPSSNKQNKILIIHFDELCSLIFIIIIVIIIIQSLFYRMIGQIQNHSVFEMCPKNFKYHYWTTSYLRCEIDILWQTIYN